MKPNQSLYILISTLFFATQFTNLQPIYAAGNKRSEAIQSTTPQVSQCDSRPEPVLKTTLLGPLIKIRTAINQKYCGWSRQKLAEGLTEKIASAISKFRKVTEQRISEMEPKAYLADSFLTYLTDPNHANHEKINEHMNNGIKYEIVRTQNNPSAWECSNIKRNAEITTPAQRFIFASCFHNRADQDFIFSTFDGAAKGAGTPRGLLNSYVDILSEHIKLSHQDLNSLIPLTHKADFKTKLTALKPNLPMTGAFIQSLLEDPKRRQKTQFITMTLDITDTLAILSGINATLTNKIKSGPIFGDSFLPIRPILEGTLIQLQNFSELHKLQIKANEEFLANSQLSEQEKKKLKAEIRKSKEFENKIAEITKTIAEQKQKLDENSCAKDK
jgi:hypothetical protein